MTLRAFLKVCLFASTIIVCGPVFAQTYNLGIRQQLALWEQYYGLSGRDAAAREGRDSFYSPNGCNSNCIGCDENPLFHEAKYFGKVNDAATSDAYLTEEEARNYAALGELTCIVEGKRYRGTAFLGGTADTIITVAHNFEGVTNSRDCTFRRYDREGKLIPGQEYAIIDFWSRWQELKTVSNERELDSHEYAIARLERKVTGVAHGLTISANQTQVEDIMVVGFQSIVPKETRTALRKTYGKIHDKTGSGLEDFDNLIVFDATVSPRSSGAAIIDVSTGKAIGLVVGMPEEAEALGTDFSVVDRNFHTGILFDRQFIRDYKKFLGIE